MGALRVRLCARAKCVRFAPAGNSFAVASTEGLLVFTQDSTQTFAPFELDEDVTPDTIRAAQSRGEHSKALVVRGLSHHPPFSPRTPNPPTRSYVLCSDCTVNC
jgi:hypothetical protein